MREVKLLKNLPWLVFAHLWVAGTALWLLFVVEQQNHAKENYYSQLEHLSEELMRSRLEGRLGPDELPDGIQTFAVYDPQGDLVASWGTNAPETVSLPTGRPRATRLWEEKDGWCEFTKSLEPLRPRMMMGDADDRPPIVEALPPRLGGRNAQGFLFLRVSDVPLTTKLWAWSLAGGVGSAAWSGFVAFFGVLWFRTRKYQAALAQHRELLQFAEASRTLGHELQNPLAAILLQTALLKRSSGDDVAPEVLVIEEEAQRMSGLVTRVRDFLKDPKGHPEVVDLQALVQGLADRFAVAVVTHADGSPPFCVAFEPYRLRSVVENLLKNAVESGPDPRPEVRLSRPRAGWVRLEVLDAGPGFTADALKNALTPFYTTKTKGTGIGLSIADSFVQAAGGRLRLENRPEGGARVSLDVPEAPRELP